MIFEEKQGHNFLSASFSNIGNVRVPNGSILISQIRSLILSRVKGNFIRVKVNVTDNINKQFTKLPKKVKEEIWKSQSHQIYYWTLAKIVFLHTKLQSLRSENIRLTRTRKHNWGFYKTYNNERNSIKKPSQQLMMCQVLSTT